MWIALAASPAFQAIMASPWVKNFVIPLVSNMFLTAMDRYNSDPKFAEKVDAAGALKKAAITKEEKFNAAKATADALFSLHS
jgi:hypothetical protein